MAAGSEKPCLGVHCSAAGGLHKAVERIAELDGAALQLFTRNQRQWQAPHLTAEEIEKFSLARTRWGAWPVASHDSYLINLASPEKALRKRSIAAFAAEVERCAALGIELLVTHPGNHKGSGSEAAEQGLSRYVAALDEALEQAGKSLADGSTPRILLETTAGMGTALGGSFEELAAIINASRHKKRLGVCLDTCHIFAAGYDLRTPEVYDGTLKRFEDTVGLQRLGLLHLNDSKHPFASRKDRHEHIGRGELGLEPFRLLLHDSRLADVPMVLETPKDKKEDWDRMNLETLRGLL